MEKGLKDVNSTISFLSAIFATSVIGSIALDSRGCSKVKSGKQPAKSSESGTYREFGIGDTFTSSKGRRFRITSANMGNGNAGQMYNLTDITENSVKVNPIPMARHKLIGHIKSGSLVDTTSGLQLAIYKAKVKQQQ